MAKSSATQGDVLETLRGVVGGVKAGTVFGTPVSHRGIMVLPVARISGGAGGGQGDNSNERAGEGSGGGFGLSARPIGVYVIGDGKVTWSPAVDVTRVILGGQLVGIVALLTLRTLFKVIRDRRRRQISQAVEDSVPEPSQNGHVQAPAAEERTRGPVGLRRRIRGRAARTTMNE